MEVGEEDEDVVVVGREEDGGEGGDGGEEVVDYCRMVSRFVLFCCPLPFALMHLVDLVCIFMFVSI